MVNQTCHVIKEEYLQQDMVILMILAKYLHLSRQYSRIMCDNETFHK